MLDILNPEILVALLLACTAPTIAFAGVNTSFLTFRQIVVSLVLLSAIALALGGAASALSLPPVAVGLMAVGCFLVFSEGFIADVFPKKKA